MADLILIIELAVYFSANTRSNQLCWGDSEMETARFCHVLLHGTRLGIISELKH